MLFDAWIALPCIVVTTVVAATVPGCGSSTTQDALNSCPVIDAFGAATAETRIGRALELRSSAHDLDRGPSPLTYRWTATSGTLSDPAAQSPKFTCATLGEVTVTLTVEDGDRACPVSTSLSLTCTPALLSDVGHLVVVYMENHSFDSLFGSYPGAEGLSSASARIAQVDETGVPYVVLPQTDTHVPDRELPNQPFDITRFRAMNTTTIDLVHEYNTEQAQINGGKMDKFVALSDAKGLTVGYYPTAELPIVRLIASMPDQATVCDHFFHAAFGCSFLNHFWLIAARTPVFPNAPAWMVPGVVTPDGFAVNTLLSINTPRPAGSLDDEVLPYQTFPTIGDRLNEAGVDWAWFAGGWDDAVAGRPDGSYAFHHQPFIYFSNYADRSDLKDRHLKDENDFLAGLAAGKLPEVSFVKPLGMNTEHPGGTDLETGQKYLVNVIQRIKASTLWNDTVVIVTYDENGGFWDHVPPPKLDRFGPGARVPAIVFSPFAKGGVDATTYDTTAILKLIEKRWSLEPLSDRDAAQEDLSAHALHFATGAAATTVPAAMAGECSRETSARTSSVRPPVVSAYPPVPLVAGEMSGRSLTNPFAYVPPQCYAKTRHAGQRVSNSCYPCHQRPSPPNFVDDADLQLRFQFSRGAATNRWRNVLDPPGARAVRTTDDEVLAHVRKSNYLDDRGEIAVAARLDPLEVEWDGEGDHAWNGYVPDAWFRFDDLGFDVGPGARETGWRAFAYYPLPGAFFPTNGSMDDVLIRLDPALRENADGKSDRRVYEINLAIVEALIKRRDVAIDPTDEELLDVDLDLDGTLGRATHVAFDAQPNGGTRMRYVGRARDPASSQGFPIAPGLFPLRTEFLHSVRYLDVASDGRVVMAPRMKELRYAKKTNWLTPDDLRAKAANEVIEQRESPIGARRVRWEFDRGIDNGQGWLLQGFIEASDGSLRPQSYEESVYCAGCHGGIGATTDSMFALSRKLGADAPARGWFHWTQHDLRGIREPRREDGSREYSQYLLQNGAGDDFHENGEVLAKFFDESGRVRPDRLTRLHEDVAELLLPSAVRALDLDRAYRAIVVDQSFSRGRDALLAASHDVYAAAPVGEKTGVREPVSGK